QQPVPTWLGASALWFHCDEYRVDLLQGLGIVDLQHPSLVCSVVLIKDSQTYCSLPVGTSLPPRLERARVFNSGLLVQVISVKDKRLVLREKDASKWLLCVTVSADVVYFREVQIPST